MNKIIQSYSAIILDACPKSQADLQDLLEELCPGVRIVATGDSICRGMELIDEHHPDIIFSEVRVGNGCGFKLLESLPGEGHETIFITDHAEYALDAIQKGSCYYMLKPINHEDLKKAVARAKRNIKNRHIDDQFRMVFDNLARLNKYHHKIPLPTSDGFEVVEMNKIVWCKANGNYTDFFMTDGKMKRVCGSIKIFENKFSGFGIIRVHKSHMVNMEYIKKYKHGKSGELTIEDGSRLEVSNTYKKNLLNLIAAGF